MTCGSDAGLNNVFSNRVMPELRIESGDSGNGIRRDISCLSQMLECGGGKPVVFALDRLKERDQILRTSPNARHHLVDLGEINVINDVA